MNMLTTAFEKPPVAGYCKVSDKYCLNESDKEFQPHHPIKGIKREMSDCALEREIYADTRVPARGARPNYSRLINEPNDLVIDVVREAKGGA